MNNLTNVDLLFKVKDILYNSVENVNFSLSQFLLFNYINFDPYKTKNHMIIFLDQTSYDKNLI